MKNLIIKNRRNGLKSQTDNSHVKALLLRILTWILFIIIPVSAFFILKMGFYRLFFYNNPHFIIQELSIINETGSLSDDYIRNQLKIKPGVENLYAIDLRQLRRRLLRDPLIREIQIRRILPETLELRVHGRTPIAQLIKRGGRLIDSENVILGEGNRSNANKWPIITGIPDISSFVTGNKINNPMVTKAIQLLRLKDVIRNGHWLDVNVIQLDNNYRELRIYLNGKKEFWIRDGAVIVLPYDDLKEALYRATAILEQRIKAKQPTSFIDATYEKRVPVRP